MKVNLKTTGDVNFEGICPSCKEHTTAGDSCCGEGAWVEGGLITDQSALESQEDPYVCIKLLQGVSEKDALAVKSLLFDLNVPVTAFSNGLGWSVNLFVPISDLNKEER